MIIFCTCVFMCVRLCVCFRSLVSVSIERDDELQRVSLSCVAALVRAKTTTPPPPPPPPPVVAAADSQSGGVVRASGQTNAAAVFVKQCPRCA